MRFSPVTVGSLGEPRRVYLPPPGAADDQEFSTKSRVKEAEGSSLLLDISVVKLLGPLESVCFRSERILSF